MVASLGMPPRNTCPGCHSAIYDGAREQGWCTDCMPPEIEVLRQALRKVLASHERGDGGTLGERLWAEAEAQASKRAADMPDENAALRVMFNAYQRLRELGWGEAIYCPKDGTYFDAIEAGSMGVHACTYWGEWPKGGWWVADDNDLWPSHPILFRLRATDTGSSAGPQDSTEAK